MEGTDIEGQRADESLMGPRRCVERLEDVSGDEGLDTGGDNVVRGEGV